MKKSFMLALLILSLLNINSSFAVEINGSPFATADAPLPGTLRGYNEKVILVNPSDNNWGAYAANGKLIRWGIATAGSYHCADTAQSCKTSAGQFRIYSLGSSNCISHKYDGAPMPYCMFFNGSQALHGSSDVQFKNISHGCVRIHIDDAKWLRYHFVEGPNPNNHFHGTLVIIKPY